MPSFWTSLIRASSEYGSLRLANATCEPLAAVCEHAHAAMRDTEQMRTCMMASVDFFTLCCKTCSVFVGKHSKGGCIDCHTTSKRKTFCHPQEN